MADDKPIIVVKKKGGHGGHHGGAWKIAYADFVTAMMAFFMVMWLVNSASTQTKQSIASYFRKPGIFNEGSGTPVLLGEAGILSDAFVPPHKEEKDRSRTAVQTLERHKGGELDQDLDRKYVQEGTKEPQPGKGPDEIKGLNSDQQQLEEIKKNIDIRRKAEGAKEELLRKLGTPEFKELIGQLDFKIDADGLTVEIMDTDKASMFERGSATIRPEARDAFSRVTDILKKYPNTLEIVGHTDAKPFPSRTGGYTNWELSADRANAARRLIEGFGFPPGQIGSVIGKASQELKRPDDPLAASNRRITLKMKFSAEELTPTATPTPPPSEAGRQDLATPTPEVAQTPLPRILGPLVPTPTRTPTPTPTPLGEEPPRKGVIRLPNSPVPTGNPDYMENDKVFKDKPVVGPAEFFTNR